MGRERILDPSERVELATERYWLQGMDLGYSKKRALVEAAREEAQMQAEIRIIARQSYSSANTNRTA